MQNAFSLNYNQLGTKFVIGQKWKIGECESFYQNKLLK